MKCLRIYATSDGESHFGEVELPMAARFAVAPGAKPFEVSRRYPASSIEFTQIPAGMWQVEWHTVPARVLTVRLTGAVEYETSDGEVRRVRRRVRAGGGHARRGSSVPALARRADRPLD
jgi:hypothetical protein